MNDILTITEHQKISVKEKRDVLKNTISEEDKKLLFDIQYSDKDGKSRYVFSHDGSNKIKAKSIVGSISLKTGLTIEILPKFAKDDLDKDSIKQHREMLLNMIRVSNERNFISSASQSSKISVEEMPLLNYIIELFSDDLLKALRTGVYTTYNQTIENSSNIRGNILISKTIQNNIVDKSKVFTAHNRHSANNLLMQIFKTLSMLLLKDHNLSYSTKQNLYEITLLLGEVDTIELTQKDFERVVFNRLNDKFEILFKQAKFIFTKYMPFTSHINATPFWSILFNMDYLFEKFCAYLFRRSDIETQEQAIIDCYKNSHYTVSAKPDFILSSEKQQIVIDAKWKILRTDKTLYGLNTQNFWQLFSYMNLIDKEQEIKGYFIVPKNSDEFDEEIHFEPIMEGNKSITILSIDFSLPFNELIERYRFKIVNDELKIEICEKRLIEPPVEERSIDEFNLEEFIDELEILSKYNRKRLSNLYKNRTIEEKVLKNTFLLKKLQKVKTTNFLTFVKDNLHRKILRLDSLNIDTIPQNINKMKSLTHLDIYNNNLQNIPNEILDLKALKELQIDKSIVDSSVDVLIELIKHNTIIKDEDGNELNEYIRSFLETKDKNIQVETTPKIKPDNNVKTHNITIDMYRNMDDDSKMNFIDEANLTLIDEKLLQYIIYSEDNIDRLDELTYNQTLPLKYLLLIYNDHLENKEIKNNVKNQNHPILDKITSTYIENIPSYIKKNFDQIDKEILLAYAMTQKNEFYKIREKIAQLTNDLDILNELSKNRNDKPILQSILFKTQNNPNFQKIVNGNKSLYSTETLDRIAKYDEYYIFNNESCLISLVSSNWHLTNTTKKYLLNQYPTDNVIQSNIERNNFNKYI